MRPDRRRNERVARLARAAAFLQRLHDLAGTVRDRAWDSKNETSQWLERPVPLSQAYARPDARRQQAPPAGAQIGLVSFQTTNDAARGGATGGEHRGGFHGPKDGPSEGPRASGRRPSCRNET